MEITQLDKFYLNQKLLSLNSKYYVYGEGGSQLFYVDRPVLTLKIDMGIYEDDSKRKKLFSLRTKSIFEFPIRHYYLYDADDQLLAVFAKNELMGILRASWDIYSDESKASHLGHAEEDSWGKALFRRFGPLGEFLKTDFHIYVGESQVGAFIRKISIGDKYTMDLTMDPDKKFDRRIALGLGLVLDVGEAR